MWRVSQDPPQLRLLRRWPVDGRVVCAAAWDQYLAAGCGERSLGGLPRRTCAALPAATPDGPSYPGAADGAVRIFDAFTGTCSKLLRPHQQGVAALQHVRRGEEDLLVRWDRQRCRRGAAQEEGLLACSHKVPCTACVCLQWWRRWPSVGHRRWQRP